MTKHIGEVYDGIISGVLSSGIFVALPNTVEGFIPASELPKDKYELDEKNYRLNGLKYSFGIGESARVEIKSAVIETRSVNMALYEEKGNHLRKRKKGAKI
jgi:ribonuclease R